MRNAKKILAMRLGTAALVVGGCYLLYQFGLSKKAKNDIKQAARSVKDAYVKISETLMEAQGQVMEEEGTLPNVQSTKQQWESIGF